MDALWFASYTGETGWGRAYATVSDSSPCFSVAFPGRSVSSGENAGPLRERQHQSRAPYIYRRLHYTDSQVIRDRKWLLTPGNILVLNEYGVKEWARLYFCCAFFSSLLFSLKPKVWSEVKPGLTCVRVHLNNYASAFKKKCDGLKRKICWPMIAPKAKRNRGKANVITQAETLIDWSNLISTATDSWVTAIYRVLILLKSANKDVLKNSVHIKSTLGMGLNRFGWTCVCLCVFVCMCVFSRYSVFVKVRSRRQSHSCRHLLIDIHTGRLSGCI